MIFLGTCIGIMGCYLPWGSTRGVFLTNIGPESWVGIHYITMASYSFVASIFTLFLALIFVLRPKLYPALPIIFTSLAVLCFTGVWIAFPDYRIVNPNLGTNWPFNIYSVLYGAYVTLAGAILAFLTSSIQLYVTSRKRSATAV
jgi:uncharacterized membrane protein YccC